MSRQLDQIKFTYTLRSCANMYDVGFIPITYVREAAIRALGLEPGMRVLDLACGTGLNLPYLARAVGPTGEVVGLDYSAHPDAEATLRRIAEAVAAHDDVLGVAVSHRTGHLGVGEAAIVAAVASAHRAEAFAACRALIDRLKERVPIWKKELGTDGAVWVGLGP
jgi:molybdopterin synthase catalytic subunit